jgi:indolepyruvate decarboxylase
MTEPSGASPPSIGDYLIRRICETGSRHVFGVPGDYVLNFYAMLDRSPLRVINTCDEQGAGFAADAYARMQGFGVVCATYMVGGLKLLNTTAQAYAERSPVLVVAGAPGYRERERHPLLHHRAKEYDDQLRMLERVTVAAADLGDPATAFREIDRVIAEIVRTKRPGYIELPRDMVDVVPGGGPPSPVRAIDLEGRLAVGVVERVAAVLDGAERPVIVAGVEVARYGLESAVRELAARTGIPIVSTFLGKSVVDETDPRYLGVYSGAVGDESVRQYVESSDCLLLLGVLLTDVNLGGNTAVLDPERMISLSADGCRIGREACPVPGLALLPALARRDLRVHDRSAAPAPVRERTPAFTPTAARLTTERLFLALNAFVDEATVLIADVGDAVMMSMDVTTRAPGRFLCPVYYSSLGFAVPAAVGVQAARPELRPLVLVGDGAFQMTGMEVSVAARYGMNPIVVVLNNGGFGTERPMIDGPFNDVAQWRYHLVPAMLGSGKGYLVTTEDELAAALAEARGSGELSVIEVVLAPDDISPQLRRLCERLAKGVRR